MRLFSAAFAEGSTLALHWPLRISPAFSLRRGLEPRGVDDEGAIDPAIGRSLCFMPRRLHACSVLLHSGPLGRPTAASIPNHQKAHRPLETALGLRRQQCKGRS